MTKFKYLFFLIAVLMFAACEENDEIVEHITPKDEAVIMNIATYNLRYYNTDDKNETAWGNRKSRVYELIRTYEFELTGVQEVRLNQANDLIADLPEYTYYGKPRNNGINGEQVGILYKPSRFTELDKGFFWLSPTPYKESIGWGASVERICVWMKMKDTKDNKEFFFFSTHLDHQNENSRIESAKLLNHAIDSIAGGVPSFCVGDFNAKPASLPIQNMKKQFVDSWYKTLETPIGCATLNDFKPAVKPTKRIDYIFSGANITIYSLHTIEDMFGATNYPSDHFPIVVEAALK